MSGLPPRLLMFVLSLAFVDPYNNESQFGDLTGYDELSKQAIVLLIPELVGCGDGKRQKYYQVLGDRQLRKFRRLGNNLEWTKWGALLLEAIGPQLWCSF